MRCPECDSISFTDLRYNYDGVKHHQTLRDLRECASGGKCDLCALFWTTLQRGCLQDPLEAHLSGKVYGHEIITDTQIRLSGSFNEKVPLGLALYPSGSVIRVASGPEFAEGRQISSVFSYLNVFAEQETVASRFIGARYLTRRSSSLRLQMSLDWLRACEETHVDCRTSRDALMPTRLLEIGTVSCPTLKLTDTSGKLGRYAALSYFWGEDNRRPITLYNSTKESYYENIEESKMSASHIDAIQVARELGFDYIWIDALCIIQDNDEDWAVQSANMAQIYGNATITIVAGSASDSREGFINHALDRNGESVPLPYSSPMTGKVEGNCYVTLPRSMEVGPVSSRAWCFQESVLSRRMLVYGKDQLSFKCREGSQYENGGTHAYQWAEVAKYVFNHSEAQVLCSPVPPPTIIGSEALECWYTLLNLYTEKDLWQPSDIFAALAGIAYLFQKALKSRYLAGLWECDIRRGLLWKPRQMVSGPFTRNPLTERRHRIKPSRNKEQEESKLARFRAPTWSWASVNGPVIQAQTNASNRTRYSNKDDWRCFPRLENDSWSTDSWSPQDVQMKLCNLSIKGHFSKSDPVKLQSLNTPNALLGGHIPEQN